VRHLNGEVCEMQTATTGRMSTAVKSGVQALESRMPGKRAPHHPMFDPSRREGRYGRLDLRVTHPTWTRKREGKVAWWESTRCTEDV